MRRSKELKIVGQLKIKAVCFAHKATLMHAQYVVYSCQLKVRRRFLEIYILKIRNQTRVKWPTNANNSGALITQIS